MVGSGGGFADEGFQLGERHLDGVQVGRIGRQEDEVVALCAQKFDGARGFVGGEVVGNDDLAGPEGRGQIVLDVGFEYYGKDQAALPGGAKLGGVKSVANLFKKMTGATLPNSQDVETGAPRLLGPGTKGPRPVRTEGSWDR